jgi:hypothetical protein
MTEMASVVSENDINDLQTFIIPLTQGHVALINGPDWDLVEPYRWSAHINRRKPYALARKQIGKLVTRVQMHRLIMSPAKGEMVDHINGNTLDNRRSNLRIVSAQTNAANMHASWGSSNYKGVYFDVRLQKWVASIRKSGVHMHIGVFGDEDDAAIAYDRKAIEVFGEHARTNAPRKLYDAIDAALSEGASHE